MGLFRRGALLFTMGKDRVYLNDFVVNRAGCSHKGEVGWRSGGEGGFLSSDLRKDAICSLKSVFINKFFMFFYLACLRTWRRFSIRTME